MAAAAAEPPKSSPARTSTSPGSYTPLPLLRKDVGLVLDVARAQGAAKPSALEGLANAALDALEDAGKER